MGVVMLALLKNVNLLVAFLLELAVLVSLVYWGWHAGTNLLLKLAAGIGIPVVFAVAWGLFAAPKASWALHGVARFAFEVVWFGSGAAALVAADLVVSAGVFVVVCVVSKVLVSVWHQ
jgi:hypothetical protein